jgi:hypothetical protein
MPFILQFLRPPIEEGLLIPGFLRALDRASLSRRDWPEEGVQRLLAVLKKRGSLGDVCKRFGLFANEMEEQHVREDWFGEGGKGWWPKEPMEALFRKGMIRAIELLREHDLPLAACWRVGKGIRHAQITFFLSPQQITLTISTPPPRRTTPGRLVTNPRVWIVAHDAGRITSTAGRMPVPDDPPPHRPLPCES